MNPAHFNGMVFSSCQCFFDFLIGVKIGRFYVVQHVFCHNRLCNRVRNRLLLFVVLACQSED